jgi:pyridoxal phosphate enzyme (YggS family)
MRMSIAENLKKIKSVAGSATLVAVSKKQPPGKILGALAAGHRVFGENRVQEAEEHWSDLRRQYADLELHLIGPLQTNKVKDAVSLFDVIQSVDREKLAKALGEEMKKQNRPLPCFIQVNTGEEEQKAGIAPAQVSDFLKFCRGGCGLNIIGLMCIPPVEDPPALHFALLKKLGGENGLKNLSMGMSGDYEAALKLGATHIRVGTGIFGERS